MTNKFSFIVQFFIVTAAVITGVYLGLKAYDYDQQLKNKALENKAIANIEQELKGNAGRVSLSLD